MASSGQLFLAVNDNGFADNEGNFTADITVTPVNDAPSFTAGPNQTVDEDSGPHSLAWATNVFAGPADESGQHLTFQVSNDNNSLFSAQPQVAPNGTLSYTPAPNASGSATVSVTLKDDGGTEGGADTSATKTFTITVRPVNDAPRVRMAAGGSCGTNDPSGTIYLTVDDPDDPPEDPPEDLTLAGASSNKALVPNANISFSGGGQMRTMTVRPAEGQSGTANITITLSDGALKSTRTVTVKVGTNGTDAINGTTRVDMLFGLDGVDALNGLGSNDLLCGGKGVDALNGNNGDDTLSGGGGADRFSGGVGTDTVIDFTPSQGDTKDSTIP